MSDNDIIAAIATAPGRGGIGIVRVSGPRLESLTKSIIGGVPPARRAVLSEFCDARGEVIDQGIAVFYPAPRSYTGEDVLELQGHGGPVVLREILKRCLELGARLARPGEFTERAYVNDKLDLAQAESVADLIDAATAQAARSAMRSLQGAFSKKIDELSRAVIDLRALVEATLDFPEEDIDFLKQADAQGKLAAVSATLDEVLTASRQGSLLREGIHVVLAGRPNVGKSSLLNCLAGEELAIVTEVPGTTRDLIRQSISLDGVPAHVIDTAGLRESDDPVERIGIERAWGAILKADFVVLMIDATLPEDAAERAILNQLPGAMPCVTVMNKIDLLGLQPGRTQDEVGSIVRLSAKTGAGIDLLRQSILEAVGWRGGGEGLFMARERHVHALRQAAGHLARAKAVGARLELLAEELRLAQEALGTITGEFTPDDLLGAIFSRFCIGK
jgi:tRNA modification GTPase